MHEYIAVFYRVEVCVHPFLHHTPICGGLVVVFLFFEVFFGCIRPYTYTTLFLNMSSCITILRNLLFFHLIYMYCHLYMSVHLNQCHFQALHYIPLCGCTTHLVIHLLVYRISPTSHNAAMISVCVNSFLHLYVNISIETASRIRISAI